MKVNFSDKTVTFTKNNNNKYTISFTLLPGDQLYPCVLFYYINDEVEFLPNHKFWQWFVICLKIVVLHHSVDNPEAAHVAFGFTIEEVG